MTMDAAAPSKEPVKFGIRVHLNIYDIPDGPGRHHSGVEILQAEYSYADEVGIFKCRPKKFNHFIFTEQLYMGMFYGGLKELKDILEDLRQNGFPDDGYDRIQNNCNDFTEQLCQKLVGKSIPEYINEPAVMARGAGGCTQS